jgi:hypothetical protein
VELEAKIKDLGWDAKRKRFGSRKSPESLHPVLEHGRVFIV